MAASFSVQEQHVRQLGNRLESEVAKGEELPRDPFEKILRLPRSDMRYLKDTFAPSWRPVSVVEILLG